MTPGGARRRRLLAPEVVQTSAMDCGPASLKCLLEGHRIPVSYGRLREACRTDVDGTSIDTLEEVARTLGLEAEQVMVPVDHVLLTEARTLPAVLVVRLPNGFTHFLVVWRRVGRYVQVMDPSSGRRWLPCAALLRDVYAHAMAVPASGWREWAGSLEFRLPLAGRMMELGTPGALAAALIESATGVPDWQPLARLDAVTRLVASLVRSGAVPRGPGASRLLEALLDRSRAERPGEGPTLPPNCWSVLPAPCGPDGEERLVFHGAVLVRIRGVPDAGDASESVTARSPELAAALAEPPTRPLRQLGRFLAADGLFAPAVLAGGIVLAVGSVLVEALVLRGAIDIGRDLGLVEQRLSASACLLLFVAVLLALELGMAASLARLGRRLELRVRSAVLEKIPRLHDRYLQSRPVSDMAERGHSLHRLRVLPRFGGRVTQVLLQLLATAAAISWLDPGSAALALTAALMAIGLPLAARPLLEERDLRLRTHAGALNRFYLDALLGLAAVRAHSAERAVRREHESLLVEWVRAGRGLLGCVVALEGAQAFVGFGLAAWLLARHAAGGADPGAALLLTYWALTLPLLGEEIALLARQYPALRTVGLRALEPLGAPEGGGSEAQMAPAGAAAVALRFERLRVTAAGRVILTDIDFELEAGSHVAIVGASGAGKSTLIGLLLGWHRPAAGQVLVDGAPLDRARLERLREETAWVDPAVQLWNRSLFRNVTYGLDDGALARFAGALEAADLHDVVERLPDGLQTRLGEGGGQVSGGEGQRVRLARALLRRRARLVILDEPFRGLERDRRRELLQRARQIWHGATLLCITHDVAETRGFDRVLVLEDGRIVEDGGPAALAQEKRSRYRALLDAESALGAGIWSNDSWRRLQLETGRLTEMERSPRRWSELSRS